MYKPQLQAALCLRVLLKLNVRHDRGNESETWSDSPKQTLL